MSRNKSQTRTGLARTLSKLGYCSRSSAAKLIAEGRVRLNGRIARDPEQPVAFGRDRIQVHEQDLKAAKKIYLMMNKPRGLITSVEDEQGRDTVYSLLPEYRQWLAPVGRLDKASEGLLLFTNDSSWAEAIASPEAHLEKTYHVQIKAIADEVLLERIVAGVQNDNGFLRAKRATIVRHGGKNSWLEIVLDEGKNRHIRRIMDALGVEVLRLIRIGIGPLKLGDLPKGSVRELTQEEKKAIEKTIRASGESAWQAQR